MATSVSVEELQQNPKPTLDAVQDGQTVIVTKHGRPIAELGPHRSSQGASADAVFAVIAGRADAGWRDDLAQMRAGIGRGPREEGVRRPLS